MTRFWLAIALISGAALCAFAVGPLPGQIKNLVTFGDSYTDVDAHADGGIMWPIFAAQEGRFKLFPFAKYGAPCSQKLTPLNFPSVFENELPLYFAERANGTLELDPFESVYTLWVGTNDVGQLLLGRQPHGITIFDTVACAVNWIRVLYKSGARNFIFQNMIPLETTPLYAPHSYPNRYWTGPRNETEWSLFILELTTSGNAIAKLMLEALAPTLPGAHIALFDSHALFTDMYNRPQRYLNGTAPLNVTGAAYACVFRPNESTSDLGTCTIASGFAQDSFLWFDELHPSVQANRVIAKAISDVIHRKADKWATWLS